jgi:hypothetical protein
MIVAGQNTLLFVSRTIAISSRDIYTQNQVDWKTRVYEDLWGPIRGTVLYERQDFHPARTNFHPIYYALTLLTLVARL